MIHWKSRVILIALIICAAVPAPAQTATPEATTRLRIAIVSRTVFYAPLWIAAQAGYFQKAGLGVDIEVFDNAEKIAEALRSGAVQVAISTPETVMVDAMKGGDLRIIAGNAERLPHFVIAKPDIKSPSQLKGAVFGVLSLNEGTTYLVHEYARSIGLREADYTIKPVGGAPTRWNLLREGKIDAGLQPFPLSYEAEAAGFTNLGPIAGIVPEWQFTSVNVNRRWAERNRMAVGAFLVALKQGTDTIQSNRALAVEVTAKELNTTPGLAARALDDTQSLKILSQSLAPSEAGLRTVMASLIATQQLPLGTVFEMDKFVDVTYLRTSR